ncbi:MAG: rRNA maturation RNase YbeY [Chloroflexi bacterium]|nr:rRNA maturation RNase YbeY [Chloroflexota bacterium]
MAQLMSIEINVVSPFEDRVSCARLHRAVAATLEEEGMVGNITLIISDDPMVTDLNRRFLGNDGPTDVLSFPTQSEADLFTNAPEEELYLGDIIIAYPFSAAQAVRHNQPIDDELDLLAVHGTLHLLGYDHAELAEKGVMWARQEAIIGVLRSG